MVIRLGLHVSVTALALSMLWPRSAGSAPDEATLQWQKGLSLFKQKKFSLACPLFESAAKAKRDDALIWSDLAKCELKRGNEDEAAHAALLAARFGDEKLRSVAYGELKLAGVQIAIPANGFLQVPAAPELECSKSAFARVESWQAYGAGAGEDGVVAYVAGSAERAQFLAEDYSRAEAPDDHAWGGFSLSKTQRCFDWCAKHPLVHCKDTCREFDIRSCTIVFVDPCQQRVGCVCEGSDQPNQRKRVHAEEFQYSDEEPEPGGE